MEDDRVHPQPSLLSVSMKSPSQSGGTLADAFIIASVCRTVLGIKGLGYPLWDSKDIWLICGTHQFSGGAAGETRYLGEVVFLFFFPPSCSSSSSRGKHCEPRNSVLWCDLSQANTLFLPRPPNVFNCLPLLFW